MSEHTKDDLWQKTLHSVTSLPNQRASAGQQSETSPQQRISERSSIRDQWFNLMNATPLNQNRRYLDQVAHDLVSTAVWMRQTFNLLLLWEYKSELSTDLFCYGTYKRNTNWSRLSVGLLRLTRMESRVQTSVMEGVTQGRTECWNSWTNPPVMEARGSSASCSSFRRTPEQVHRS